MQESEVKRVKRKRNEKVQRDANMKGGARGGDPEAKSKIKYEETPIIQPYSE